MYIKSTPHPSQSAKGDRGRMNLIADRKAKLAAICQAQVIVKTFPLGNHQSIAILT